MSWHWEEVDVSRSGAAGDLSKLFKNEGIKEPGAFAKGAPPADSTLLAREVIQNSWDAARELAEERDDVDFAIEFRFRDVTGDEKRQLAEALGLDGLAHRVDAVDVASKDPEPRIQLGLRQDDCLGHLDDDAPLRVLEIHEHGTTGMYGPFEGTSSKLYLALVSIGFTAKASGSGGSYGYGKAGLIRGSAIRSVVAYTCFEPRADDGDTTRRLLGMTYWGRHSAGGKPYTGFGRFGFEDDDGNVVPFENEAADEVAGDLGLPVRDASDSSQLGTSFLLVEPTIDPESLKTAIERSWWPALNDHEFSVEIHTADGDRLIPRPKTDPLLKTFIRAYELARVHQDSELDGEWSGSFNRTTVEGESLALGRTGLVADVNGWSYPTMELPDEDDDENGGQVRHRSLVALVRGPKMVVEYLEAGQHMPFVRGAFIADPDVDDLLRQTEPKAHDSWQTKVDTDGMDPHAPEVADKIIRGIRRRVNDFRRKIKPPTPDRKDIRLPVLEDLFRQILDGQGSKSVGPDPAPRQVSIKIDQALEKAPEAPDRIRMTGSSTLALTEHHPEPRAVVDVRVRYVFVEDGRSGEACELDVDAPDGFDVVDADKGWYRGELGHDPVEFRFRSGAYRADWSGKLSVKADPAEEVAPS